MVASPGNPQSCIAFAGTSRIAAGDLPAVARRVREALDAGEARPVLVFDAATGAVVDVDVRGTAEEVVRRLTEEAPVATPPTAAARRSPGRPRLGVVGREVTLLPRHWDWLGAQPGGASVALRKLVEQARRADDTQGNVRRSREAAYRFMSAMAGNEPGFEEASRALFAGDRARFVERTESWPSDVRDHARRMAGFEP